MLEGSILHHVCIVLLSLLLLSSYNCCHPVAYFVSLFYLYLVHDRYVMRLRRKLRFEERRNSFQRRVLSDSETVRWLNHMIEKIWPICMEQVFSQKVLLPIIPWFLEKYKPWTVKEAVVQHLYMGRSPPIFTEMRVLRQATGDDHLVLELGMNFRTADDMSAILAVKFRKRLGFGMKAKLHLVGLHIEGKVLIGVKFLHQWPFLGRLKVSFVEPPYFQLTVKPVFSHGLDVTELPGIAGWLDKLLAIAFEQTLVEPNMLLVDMEKFVSPQAESWFSVDEKEPVAYALLEIIEAADVKPSDLNGLADPYVKGQLAPYRFRTKTQRKTLDPKWYEEFKVPIFTWELPNVLAIEVRDKDRFVDDTLGECSISVNDFRDGQRHDMWLPLRNIKMGRLHLAITVIEANGKGPGGQPCGCETLNDNREKNWYASETAHKGSFSSRLSEKSPKIVDTFEPIDIVGQRETGIWVHCPGSDVSQIWEPRKGRTRGDGGGGMVSSKSSASRSYNNNGNFSYVDESQEGNKGQVSKKVLRGLKKIFHKNSRNEDLSCEIEEPLPSPCTNLKAVDETTIGVKLIMEDNFSSPSSAEVPMSEGEESCEGSGPETSRKRRMKGKAKSISKHAGRSARGVKNVLSRKWSKKSQGDSGPPLPEGIVGSETSDEEESLHSIVSRPISRCGSGTSKSTVGDPVMGIEDPINNKLQSWRLPEHIR